MEPGRPRPGNRPGVGPAPKLARDSGLCSTTLCADLRTSVITGRCIEELPHVWTRERVHAPLSSSHIMLHQSLRGMQCVFSNLVPRLSAMRSSRHCADTHATAAPQGCVALPGKIYDPYNFWGRARRVPRRSPRTKPGLAEPCRRGVAQWTAQGHTGLGEDLGAIAIPARRVAKEAAGSPCHAGASARRRKNPLYFSACFRGTAGAASPLSRHNYSYCAFSARK
jgi:hypothetical protein